MDVAVRHLEEKDGCTYVDGILIVNKTYSLPESYDPAGLTDETGNLFVCFLAGGTIVKIEVRFFRHHQIQLIFDAFQCAGFKKPVPNFGF